MESIAELLEYNPPALLFDDDTCSVILSITDRMLEEMQKQEYAASVLDLANLKDAFLIDAVNRVLEALGYDQGYFASDHGLVFCQKNCPDLLLPYQEKELVIRAKDVLWDYDPLGSLLNEEGYLIEKDGKTYKRNPYYSLLHRGFTDAADKIQLIDEDVCVAVLKGRDLLSCKNAAELQEACEKFGQPISWKAENEEMRANAQWEARLH